MKSAITTAVLSLLLASPAGMMLSTPAHAAEYQTSGGKQTYACERGPIDKVALTAPTPCCAGQMVCSQFLSTGTMVKPPHQERT